MEIKLQDATLSNIANGVLEQQWGDAMREVASVFAEATSRVECPYEIKKDGSLTVRLQVEVDVIYSVETHTQTVAARIASVKRPKRRMAVGGIYHRDGQWSVTHEGEQANLFGAKVKGLPKRKEGTSDAE